MINLEESYKRNEKKEFKEKRKEFSKYDQIESRNTTKKSIDRTIYQNKESDDKTS